MPSYPLRVLALILVGQATIGLINPDAFGWILLFGAAMAILRIISIPVFTRKYRTSVRNCPYKDLYLEKRRVEDNHSSVKAGSIMALSLLVALATTFLTFQAYLFLVAGLAFLCWVISQLGSDSEEKRKAVKIVLVIPSLLGLLAFTVLLGTGYLTTTCSSNCAGFKSSPTH